MRGRWLSKRALLAHLCLALWIPACIWLAVWQASRASAGNSLSYVYALEWPALALFGLWGWWMLLHTEKPTPEQVAERQAEEAKARAAAKAEAEARTADVDPEMAAYNEHLKALDEKGRSKWSH